MTASSQHSSNSVYQTDTITKQPTCTCTIKQSARSCECVSLRFKLYWPTTNPIQFKYTHTVNFLMQVETHLKFNSHAVSSSNSCLTNQQLQFGIFPCFKYTFAILPSNLIILINHLLEMFEFSLKNLRSNRQTYVR